MKWKNPWLVYIWKLLYGWFWKWEIKMKLCFTALILQEKNCLGTSYEINALYWLSLHGQVLPPCCAKHPLPSWPQAFNHDLFLKITDHAQTQFRDGPLENLWGGEQNTKKIFAQGKIEWKKKSIMPINPKKYSCYGLKKIRTRNL